MKELMRSLSPLQRRLLRSGIVIVPILIFIVVVAMTCLVTIDPGNKGIVFHKFSGGVDTETIYDEGVHLISPWNKMIIYDVRQKTVNSDMKVLDKGGLEVGIDVSIVYQAKSDGIGNLHTNIGKDYQNIIIVPYARNVVREVTGQFSAEELYSTKRDQLQSLCEGMLREKFIENNIILEDVLIRDVNLPQKIKTGIEDKEAQEQKNQKAKKVDKEKEYLANAAITEAEGIKRSEILIAEGRSESIKLIQKQLSKSPQYNEYIKWNGYASTGKSPYGEHNVFGAGTSILKGLK